MRVDYADHEKVREEQDWGSCGKFHNEPLVFRKVKDLSDSHLLHIIAWIKAHPKAYGWGILQIMKNEQRYRVEKYIFVPDYEENKKVRYYLFGGDAVSIYEDEGAEKMFEKHYIDYRLLKFDEANGDTNWLLGEYSGWENYLEITEEQYKELKSLENG